MPEYFFVLIFFLVVTLGLYVRFKPRLYRSTGHFVFVNAVFLAVGFVWDQLAISRGHWVFGQQFLLGPRLGYMPVEEFGFVIIIWHFMLVVYKISEKYFKK